MTEYNLIPIEEARKISARTNNRFIRVMNEVSPTIKCAAEYCETEAYFRSQFNSLLVVEEVIKVLKTAGYVVECREVHELCAVVPHIHWD